MNAVSTPGWGHVKHNQKGGGIWHINAGHGYGHTLCGRWQMDKDQIQYRDESEVTGGGPVRLCQSCHRVLRAARCR